MVIEKNLRVKESKLATLTKGVVKKFKGLKTYLTEPLNEKSEGISKEGKIIKWFNNTPEKIRLFVYSRLADMITTGIAVHEYGPIIEDRTFPREMMEQHGTVLGLLAAQLHPLQISCLATAYLLNKYSAIRESPMKLGNYLLILMTMEALRTSFCNFINFINYPLPF